MLLDQAVQIVGIEQEPSPDPHAGDPPLGSEPADVSLAEAGVDPRRSNVDQRPAGLVGFPTVSDMLDRPSLACHQAVGSTDAASESIGSVDPF